MTYEVKTPGAVPGTSEFLKKVTDLYTENPKFCDSLVIGLLKAAVARTTGQRNAVMDEKVINFYRYVSTYSPRAAQVVWANLEGPSHRWLQSLNAQERTAPILDCSHNVVVKRMKTAAE